MKKMISFFAALLFMCVTAVPALASDAPAAGGSDLKVEIASPSAIDSVPIHEDAIEIKVSNEGNEAYDRLACYLTIVDVGRRQTYPVDEFGEEAYQTREIASLAPGETATVLIPVRVMYVGEFRFTASVIDYETGAVITSDALPVTMAAVSNLNKALVMAVAAIVPVILLGIAIVLTKKRGRKAA